MEESLRMRYLFPFGEVSSGDKIIIYGYGQVGKSYVEQIGLTQYCQIVAISDRMANFIEVPGYRVIEHKEIVDEAFDKIVIALENNRLAESAKKDLIDNGVEPSKIVGLCRRLSEADAQAPYEIDSCRNDGIIHIYIDEGGGLGDAVLMLPLLERIKEIWGQNIDITFNSRYKEIFDYVTCVDASCDENNKVKYDVYIKNYHVPLVACWNPRKVKLVAPLLYAYFISIIEFRKEYTKGIDGDKLWHFARVVNKKRCNICDFDDILKVGYKDNILISMPETGEDVLKKFGLNKNKYLVVNRDVDIDGGMGNFKLWPAKKYSELMKLIKSNFHELSLVRVGFRTYTDKIEGIDIDLTGKTSLGELLMILKNSKLLISSEGGLVHLNHYLGGKSAVIYGPTDEKYFGYDDDIICVNRSPCEMACQYISEDTTCPRGDGLPQCMQNVTSKFVFDNIAAYLQM